MEIKSPRWFTVSSFGLKLVCTECKAYAHNHQGVHVFIKAFKEISMIN